MRIRQPAAHRPARHATTNATLSIVVVSAGPADACLRAAQAVTTSSASFGAQVILVSQCDPNPALQSLLRRSGAQFVSAPAGCPRAEMCDLGMKHVTGMIVAVRDDLDVGDAAWLQVFRQLIPQVAIEQPVVVRELAVAVGGENVVMDSMIPAQAALADAPPPRQQVGDLVVTRGAPVEMAAIM